MRTRRTVSVSETVLLKGGVTVPTGVLRLAWKLEARGCTLTVDGDYLVIKPARQVTEYERALLQQWRDDLIRLVQYEPPATAS